MTKCKVNVEYLPDYDKSWGPVKKNTPDDAGFDLRACFSDDYILLAPEEYTLIPLGIKTEFTPGFEAQVRARSGLALKKGVSLVNGIGTIDAGYRGEWGAIVINHGKEPVVFNRGDRIAQVVFNELPHIEVVEGDVSTDGDRGGGFGSSGVK
jgi:dUTP pyrophosphatase